MIMFIGLIFLFCVFVLLFYVGSDISVFYFYPTKVERTHAIKDEVVLTKPNNNKLYALYRRTNSPKVILFLHGNAGNIYMRQNVLNLIGNEHNLLMIDYSGFGKSDGIANLTNIQNDVVFTYRYLLEQGFREENIILYGESIGCTFACYLCTIFSPSKIVLQSGPSSINDVVNNMYNGAGNLLGILCDHLNAYQYLNQKQNPNLKVLILHSRTDEVVPWSCAEKMSKHATNFLEITGGHNYSLINYSYVNNFINSK